MSANERVVWPRDVWRIRLREGFKRPESRFEVLITDTRTRQTVRGRGTTPLEAQHRAETQLVVKPWICASDVLHYEQQAKATATAAIKLEQVEKIVAAVLGGRLGYTAGINNIAALFPKQEVKRVGAD